MKLESNSIKRNFIMNCILTASSIIFPLITFPYVTRVLTPVYLGKVTYATSIIAYFTMFANLGIPTYGVRLCAGVKNDREELSQSFCELLIINTITCLLAYILLFICFFLIKPFYAYKTLLIIISFTLIFNVLGVDWLYRGLEQYGYITKRSILFKLISVVGMFCLVHSSEDYYIYAVLTILASVGSNILNFINARKIISFKTYKRICLRRHIKPILVFFAMSIATQIYTNLDSVMLGWLKGDSEVAFYSAAVKIKCVLFSVVTSLSAVLLPRASQYIKEKRIIEFRTISSTSMEFVTFISLPMVAYFMFYARNSIYLLCGYDYIDAFPAMVIIMPTVFLIGLSNVTGIQMMVPLGLEIGVFFSEVIGATVDFIINLILIPKFGSSGASVGTLIAEIVVLIVQILYLRKNQNLIVSDIKWWKYIIALGGFCITIVTCEKILTWNMYINMMISGLMSICLYLLILRCLKATMLMSIIDDVKKRVQCY